MVLSCFSLIIKLSYNICSSLDETHRPRLCSMSLYLFLFIKTLHKLTLLSIRQYNLVKNHLLDVPQIKMGSRLGCFPAINTLLYRKWGGLCISTHSMPDPEKIAGANLWRHSRSKRHSQVCRLGALPVRDLPISSFFLVGCHLEPQLSPAAPLIRLSAPISEYSKTSLHWQFFCFILPVMHVFIQGYWAMQPQGVGIPCCFRVGSPHGMGLRLDQSLVGNIHNFLSHPDPRTSCRKDKLSVKSYVTGLMSQSVPRKSSLIIGAGQFRQCIHICLDS